MQDRLHSTTCSYVLPLPPHLYHQLSTKRLAYRHPITLLLFLLHVSQSDHGHVVRPRILDEAQRHGLHNLFWNQPGAYRVGRERLLLCRSPALLY